MYPILGRYGPFFLYSYTAVLAIGLLVSAVVCGRLARHRDAPDWVDGALVAVLAALVGGRAVFVGSRWGYFGERPSEIMNLWQGGLSYHGALVVGFLALVIWCWWGKRPLFAYLTLFAPALALLMAFGWGACLLEGCGFGETAVLTGSGWQRGLMADLPDYLGVYDLR